MDELLKDSRFAHVAKDPKFRRIPRAERKVKIDKRFQGMFKDKKFAVKYTIDKRGRPVSQTSTDDLKKYYELSSSEEDSADEQVSDEKEESLKKKSKKPEKEESLKKKSKKPEKEESLNKKSKKPEKKKDKKTKQLKKNKSVEDDDASEDEDSSDNCISSNGELLRIKHKQDCDESESEAETSDEDESDAEFSKAELADNEKQLHVRKKGSAALTEKVKEKLQDLSVNYARGEGVLVTDSSSDDESSEDPDEDDEIDHNWGELDKEAETTEEITHRLAVCNMDWDRIRAVDLLVLFNSFLPSGGLIRSVTIYPSEFGLQRMKEEEISGPIELTQTSKDREIDDEDECEEGSEYHMEKLRQYQLNRLKYYYAVVDFDSPETANKVYTECDGTEYESTATKLDLRFIPDDMEFDQTPKEVCNEVPELSKYQPRQFTTTALQQVKVELTWDETNPERQEIAQRLNSGKLDEINENDLQTYLAGDSSDDDSEEDKKETKPTEDKSDSENEDNADPIEKYKSLLKEIEEKEEEKQKKEVELEFTWGLGAKEKAEKLVKERLKKDENLTPFEQYLEKRKAKKKAKRDERKKLQEQEKDGAADSDNSVSDSDEDEADQKTQMKNGKSSRRKKNLSENESASSDDEDEDRRKAELELLLMDENDAGGKQHFNMKKIEENASMSKSKQKRLSKKKSGQEDLKEDEFEVNVKDPRFNALFTSHHFNIDPADPHFRKTKGTEALVKEKLKRRANDDVKDEVEAKQPKTTKKLNSELQTLIKSVKKHAQNINRPIK